MKNALIREEIKSVGSMHKIAQKMGIMPTSLYNKIRGDCPWRVSELLALAKICGWTEEKFLDIIGWKGENE